MKNKFVFYSFKITLLSIWKKYFKKISRFNVAKNNLIYDCSPLINGFKMAINLKRVFSFFFLVQPMPKMIYGNRSTYEISTPL